MLCHGYGGQDEPESSVTGPESTPVGSLETTEEVSPASGVEPEAFLVSDVQPAKSPFTKNAKKGIRILSNYTDRRLKPTSPAMKAQSHSGI